MEGGRQKRKHRVGPLDLPGAFRRGKASRANSVEEHAAAISKRYYVFLGLVKWQDKRQPADLSDDAGKIEARSRPRPAITSCIIEPYGLLRLFRRVALETLNCVKQAFYARMVGIRRGFFSVLTPFPFPFGLPLRFAAGRWRALARSGRVPSSSCLGLR